jgi:hypothetical protein
MGTLYSGFCVCYVSGMAENRGVGQVAEWFKAAVLKTPSGKPSQPAETLHFRHLMARKGRVSGCLAQCVSARTTAQNVREVF